MKNLKKVLALVVVFAMMVSSVAFAAIYPDVAADANYANAVSVLSDLGMIKGDDKGNFNPDATITRAEFATMITRLLGVESAATGKANFDDVAADHWATGYIAMAQQQGIISGYGDGKFGPENPVKYEEAVKMLVCALGYEQMAVAKGGWVAGYLTTAYQIGLLEDANGTQGAGAPRSLVAQLCYNALDIPMMEQTGFGTEVKYEIMEKNANHDKVTLLTKMGIYKLGGTVAANTKVSFKTAPVPAASATAPASVTVLANPAGVTDKGFVEFWWDDDFDSPVKAWAKLSDNKPSYDAVVTYTLTSNTVSGTTTYDWSTSAADSTNARYYSAELLEVGETNIEDAIGNQLIVYVKRNISKYTVLAYEVDATSTSMTIKADMLDDNALSFNAATPFFKYNKEEGAAKSTRVSLENGYQTVWNNVSISSADLSTATSSHYLTSSTSASIELIDYDDNNKIDIIKVTAYDYAIVEEVDVAKGYITDVNSGRISLDIDNPDAKVSVKDVNGNDVELKDIAEGDVIAYIGIPSAGAPTNYLRNADYESLDIIVLKDNFVTGAVNGWDDVEHSVVIGDKTYDYKPLGYQCNDINLQAEGKFWLALDGETIIGFEGDVAKSGNYAFILDAYYATNKETSDSIVTLEILTKDGVAEYKIDDTIKLYNTTTYKKFDADQALNATYDHDSDGGTTPEVTVFDFLAGTELAGIEGQYVASTATSRGVTTLGDALEVIYGAAMPANSDTDTVKSAAAALRTVKIELNSSNEVTSIIPLSSGSHEDKEFSYDVTTVTVSGTPAVAKRPYDADELQLGSKNFDSKAVVIEVNFNDPENSKFTDVGYFVDENEYAALYLDTDEDGIYAGAVVFATNAVYAEGDSVAVVSAKTKALNADGDEIVKVTAVKNGEVVTLVFDDDEISGFGYAASGSMDYNSIDVGTVIMYTANGEGVVDKYDIVGTIDWTNAMRPFTFNPAFTATAIGADFDNKDSFFHGYIVDNSTVSRPAIAIKDRVSNNAENTLVGTVEGLSTIKFALKDANQYTITGAKKSSAKIEVGDYTYGNVSEMYVDNKGTTSTTDDTAEVYYVLIRTFEGKVVDIISIDVPYETVKNNPITPYAGSAFDAPAPVVTPVAPVAPVVEEKVEVKEEIVPLTGFDLD